MARSQSKSQLPDERCSCEDGDQSDDKPIWPWCTTLPIFHYHECSWDRTQEGAGILEFASDWRLAYKNTSSTRACLVQCSLKTMFALNENQLTSSNKMSNNYLCPWCIKLQLKRYYCLYYWEWKSWKIQRSSRRFSYLQKAFSLKVKQFLTEDIFWEIIALFQFFQ